MHIEIAFPFAILLAVWATGWAIKGSARWFIPRRKGAEPKPKAGTTRVEVKELPPDGHFKWQATFQRWQHYNRWAANGWHWASLEFFFGDDEQDVVNQAQAYVQKLADDKTREDATYTYEVTI